MKKKITLAGIALFAAVAGVAGLSAFEAHVINVTAQIENALFVHPESRNFGTMFPQEYAEQGIFVTFSESFSATGQTRVSKVDYAIKQKPKCAENDTNPDLENGVSRVTEDENGNFICENDEHIMLPLLCPYLSKTPANNDGNDVGVPAFHSLEAVATGTINKLAAHVGDNWTIDLAVPCFEGQCAQDWDDFVHFHNPAADPDEFMADPNDESKTFGCDLWVEVTRIY